MIIQVMTYIEYIYYNLKNSSYKYPLGEKKDYFLKVERGIKR